MRVITEVLEDEQPGLVHRVKGSSSTKYDGVGYFTTCGETLLSERRRPTYKKGIPTCLRCYVEDAKISWP